MKCAECQRELSAYLDGEVTGAVRTEIEAHVAGCADCRQRLTELRQIATGVAALPKLQPPPQFVAEVRRKIRGEGRSSWFDALFRPVWLKVPLEAVALIVVLGAVMVLVNPPLRTPTEATGGRGSVRANLPAKRKGGEGPPPSEGNARREQGEKRDWLANAAPVAMEERKSEVAKEKLLVIPMAAVAPVVGSASSKPLEAAKQRAVETITVEGADAAAVQQEAAQVASALGGRVLPQPAMTQTFQIELPQRNVLAFKSQFPRRLQVMARSMAAAADQPVVDREDADAATTVLEIQVVPPR